MKIKIISNARFKQAIFAQDKKIQVRHFPYDMENAEIRKALQAPVEKVPAVPVEGRIPEFASQPERKELIAQAAALGVKTPERLSTKALIKTIQVKR